jgi:hypothetical protein
MANFNSTQGENAAATALRSAIDEVRMVLPALAGLQPTFDLTTSLDLERFFQQIDGTRKPSANLSSKLSPVKKMLDLMNKAGCEAYGFQIADLQHLYGILRCTILEGHNRDKDMSKVARYIEEVGRSIRQDLIEQARGHVSKDLWNCLCRISTEVVRLCTIYLSQGRWRSLDRTYFNY